MPTDGVQTERGLTRSGGAGRTRRRLAKLVRQPQAYLLDSRHAVLRMAGRRLRAWERKRLLTAGRRAGDTPVTVIMTAYDTGPYVDAAVRSVLEQTHRRLELMIIDDASRDDTMTRLKKLAAGDPRIRLFHSPVNHGTYWSKNWCLKRARSEFVAFHDSDDVSHPDRLRLQLGAMLAANNRVACTVRWRRIGDDGRVVTVDGKKDRLAAISLMVRRDIVLKKAGFFDSVRIAADTEYIRRLERIFGMGAVAHLRHVVYDGLLRDGSLTRAPGAGFDWHGTGTGVTRRVTGDRAAYYDAFDGWHRGAGDTDALYRPFPAAARPFAVPPALVRGADDSREDQVEVIA